MTTQYFDGGIIGEHLQFIRRFIISLDIEYIGRFPLIQRLREHSTSHTILILILPL